MFCYVLVFLKTQVFHRPKRKKPLLIASQRVFFTQSDGHLPAENSGVCFITRAPCRKGRLVKYVSSIHLRMGI